MTQYLFCDNMMSASATCADACSACSAASENTAGSANIVMLMGAILMASIIIFSLGLLGIFLLVRAALVVLVVRSLLVLLEKVNTPGVWAQ